MALRLGRTTTGIGALSLLLAGCDVAGTSEIEDRMREHYRDPASVQFREIRVCDGDRTIVTGEVNAKNGFGAYTGFEQFFASKKTYDDSESAARFGEFGESQALRDSNALSFRCYSNLYQDTLESGWRVPNVGRLRENNDLYRTSTDTLDLAYPFVSSRRTEAAPNGFDASLKLICHRGETTLEIEWPESVAGAYIEGGEPTGKIKLDTSEPINVGSLPGQLSDSSVIQNPLPLIREMLGSSTMQASLTYVSYGDVTDTISVSFDLTGMKEAVVPIAAECGWSIETPS